ncbi:MAG: hypothetical protein KAX20_06640 [Candidatus Omnitrophica bacterium]|nr:hypothetical protein [Candidatus Omnitrophota bacterium]
MEKSPVGREIEFFIDSNCDRKNWIRLRGKPDGSYRIDGEHKWKYAASSEKNAWTAELALELKGIPEKAKKGRLWKINLCRLGGGLSQWSPGYRSFHNKDAFGYLIFK